MLFTTRIGTCNMLFARVSVPMVYLTFVFSLSFLLITNSFRIYTASRNSPKAFRFSSHKIMNGNQMPSGTTLYETLSDSDKDYLKSIKDKYKGIKTIVLIVYLYSKLLFSFLTNFPQAQ